jgi:peptide/nickel transport system permease protein
MTTVVLRRRARVRPWRKPGLTLAVVVLALIVLGAIFAPLLPLPSATDGMLLDSYLPPSIESGHWLGTDALGRDVLSRSVVAGQVSLLIGFSAAIIGAVVGTVFGTLAGYKKGPLRTAMMYVIEMEIAFPVIVAAIAIIAVLGASMPVIIGTLSIWSWVPFARVSHDRSSKFADSEFVDSARLSGMGLWYIMTRHILPNVYSPLIVIFTFTVAEMIVVSAALGFLGLGVPPPTPTWGNMISDEWAYVDIAWWATVVPCVFLSAVVLTINVIGDYLQQRIGGGSTAT